MKKLIETTNAPAAIGAYSQAIQVGDTVYVSGQLPIDPATGEFAGDDIKSQTKQSMENIKAILREAGGDMSNIVKTTVLVQDLSDFASMNEVYATYFSDIPPARAAYQVAALPKQALIEIEAVAVID